MPVKNRKAKYIKPAAKNKTNPKSKGTLEISTLKKVVKNLIKTNATMIDPSTADGQRMMEIMSEKNEKKDSEKANKTIRALMKKHGWSVDLIQETIDDIDSQDSGSSVGEEEEEEMIVESDGAIPSTSAAENPAKRPKYDWVIPKSKERAKKTKTNNDKPKEAPKATTDKPKAEKREKVPPIKTKRIESGKLDKHLKTAGIPVKYKVNKDETITVKCATNNDHEKVMTLFKGAEIGGHSYTPIALKKTVLVMKGAHFSLEINDIITDIESKTGIKVSAKRMETTKSRKGGYTLNNVLITVQEDQAKELKKIRETLNHIIYWENLKNTLITQCFNCQELGHIAKNCLNPYRCVKCKEEHLPKQCQKKIDDGKLPFCHLCQKEGHPANFRGCPKILAKQQAVDQRRASKAIKPVASNNQMTREEAQASANRVSYGISYSNTLMGTPTPPLSQPTMSFLGGECQRLFGTDMMSMLNRAREFAPIYRSARNEEEQKMLMLDFIMTIC